MLSAKFLWFCGALAAFTVFVPATFAQQEAKKPKPAASASPFIVSTSAVKWTNPPEGMAIGTPSIDSGKPLRFSLIEGDPLKPGVPFTIRLGCDDGYIAARHWHPTDENIVVLKGTFAIGHGDTYNASGMQDMKTGSYGFMPRHMHHFGLCKGDTDILVYGVGPFNINWISGGKTEN